MTKKTGNQVRGEQRREQLVEAGVALLAEGGWPVITTRAVAERADANLGLVHYHFGGLPKLRLAIAERAGEAIIAPVMAGFLGAPDERAALDALRRMLTKKSSHVTRLTTELITESLRDDDIGDMMRAQLLQARSQVTDRLLELHPAWPRKRAVGAAVLIAGLLDGLMLHHLVDPELPTKQALAALADLLDVTR